MLRKRVLYRDDTLLAVALLDGRKDIIDVS